jgi:hypothetical protein
MGDVFCGFGGCQNFPPFFRVFPDMPGMDFGRRLPEDVILPPYLIRSDGKRTVFKE